METQKIYYQIPMPLIYSQEHSDPFLYVENIKFNKMDNLSGFMEIFTRRDYEFGGLFDCVFIDVGANTADSVLYAASQRHISKVYAFEPFPQIFNLAKANINLNLSLVPKIELYNLGWSDKNTTVELPEVDDINHSAVNTVIEDFANEIVRDRNRMVSVNLCSSADCLKEIIDRHPYQPIILKMDNEGSEYDCFKDLDEHKMLDKVDVVLMEWHIKGYRSLTNILEKYNFIWFNEYLSENTGLIRAYRRR